MSLPVTAPCTTIRIMLNILSRPGVLEDLLELLDPSLLQPTQKLKDPVMYRLVVPTTAMLCPSANTEPLCLIVAFERSWVTSSTPVFQEPELFGAFFVTPIIDKEQGFDTYLLFF